MEKSATFSSAHSPKVSSVSRDTAGSTINAAMLLAVRRAVGAGASALAEVNSLIESVAQEDPVNAVQMAGLAPLLVLAGGVKAPTFPVERVALIPLVTAERMFSRCEAGETGGDISGSARFSLLPGESAQCDSVLFLARDTSGSCPLVLWWLPTVATGIETKFCSLTNGCLEVDISFTSQADALSLYASHIPETKDASWLDAVRKLAFASAACGMAAFMQRLLLQRQLKSNKTVSGSADEDVNGLSVLGARRNAARALLRVTTLSMDIQDSPNAQLFTDVGHALYCSSECMHWTYDLFPSAFKPRALALQQGLESIREAMQCFHEAVGTLKEQASILSNNLMTTTKTVKRTRKILNAGDSVQDDGRRKSSREFEILDAAADAFNSQGYDATSLDNIGSAIGITKGSIYHHYGSKADLFVAVYQRVMELNFEAIEPIAGDRSLRPVERIYRMAHTHAMQVLKHLSYQRLAVQGLEAQLIDRVNEKQREKLEKIIFLRGKYQQLFLDVFQEAIDVEEIPPQDIRMSIKPFFGAVNGATMWYKPRPEETSKDRERIAAQLAAFVTSGLTLATPHLNSVGSS